MTERVNLVWNFPLEIFHLFKLNISCVCVCVIGTYKFNTYIKRQSYRDFE